jgi:hypothetical protein
MTEMSSDTRKRDQLGFLSDVSIVIQLRVEMSSDTRSTIDMPLPDSIGLSS